MCAALLALATVAVPGVHSHGHGISCTNDFKGTVSCQFAARNCAEYNLILRNNGGYGDARPVCKGCSVSLTGQCCCSAKMDTVLGEEFTATVLKGSQDVESIVVEISKTIKPQTPRDLTVREINGNLQVMWRTDMGMLNDYLKANVMYREAGSSQTVPEFITPSTIDGQYYHQIPGRNLKPSTTYLVSVRNYINQSGLYSDRTEEVEIHTSASRQVLIAVIIVSLSVASVLISAVIYGTYVKLRTKWWDNCPNPKLPIIQKSKQQLLDPVSPSMSTICVEALAPFDSKPWSNGSLRDVSGGSPQHSSGISTGSSSLSYATTEPPNIIADVQDAISKVFANISPISPLTTEPPRDLLLSAPWGSEDTSMGSPSFYNRTYSIILPSFPQEITMDGPRMQTKEEMFNESSYHPCGGDVVICPDQQARACPLLDLSPAVVPLVAVDMSYQQCNTDSGKLSYTEDSGLSPISSGTNTTASHDPVLRFDEADDGAANMDVKASVFDDNPCYGCVPAAQSSFPIVDNDYQAFQNLVHKPAVSFPESRSGEEEEHLSKYPEDSNPQAPRSFVSPPVPGFINPGGHCLLGLPFVSLASAEQSSSVITDSGYHSV